MKKRALIAGVVLLLAFSTMLVLTGCRSDETKCMQMILEPRTYEEEEISDAFRVIREEFPEKFRNSKLLSMIYSEEMQLHMAGGRDQDGDNIVISVSICGSRYETAGDRADYYCLLTREAGHDDWTIASWAVDRESHVSRRR